MFLSLLMLTPSSPLLLTQKLNQFFGLRMVMRNVVWFFFWNIISGKLALRHDRGLGQVGMACLSLRALRLLWGMLWTLESTEGCALKMLRLLKKELAA